MKGSRIYHPQHVPIWHKDGFELKALKKQQMQEECSNLTFPS